VTSDWREFSACRDPLYPTKLFFPPEGQEPSPAVTKLCNSCTVRVNCLEFGLTLPRGSGGIYGGMSEAQREQYRRKVRGWRRTYNRSGVAS
jgi:hypothetical protein